MNALLANTFAGTVTKLDNILASPWDANTNIVRKFKGFLLTHQLTLALTQSEFDKHDGFLARNCAVGGQPLGDVLDSAEALLQQLQSGYAVSQDKLRKFSEDLAKYIHAACTTQSPTSVSPTTASATSASPTSVSPTSASATPASPTSASPTSASPTSASPTSASSTSVSPTSASPTSMSPTSASPTSDSPTSASPTSASPTSASPTSQVPPCHCDGLSPGFWRNWRNHYSAKEMKQLLPGTVASSLADVDAVFASGSGKDWLVKLRSVVLTHQLTVAWSASDLPRFDETADLQMSCEVQHVSLSEMIDEAQVLFDQARANRKLVKDKDLKELYEMLAVLIHYNCGRHADASMVVGEAGDADEAAGAAAGSGSGMAVGFSLVVLFVAVACAMFYVRRQRAGQAALNDAASVASSGDASTVADVNDTDGPAAHGPSSAWQLSRRDSHLIDMATLAQAHSQLAADDAAWFGDEAADDGGFTQHSSLARVRSAANLWDDAPATPAGSPDDNETEA